MTTNLMSPRVSHGVPGAIATLSAPPVAIHRLGPFAGRISTWTVCLLLLVGLYFPTSIDSRISTELVIGASVVLGLGLCLLMISCGLAGPAQFAVAASVFTIIGCATLFSPFTETAYGALIPVSLLTVLLSVHLRLVPATTFIRRMFDFVNIVNLAGVVLLQSGIPEVSRFLVENYSAFYPELVPSMLRAGKPILTFATHSLAGFFFYLFFYLCLRSHLVTGSRLHYVFAFSYIVILVLVNSFSSYVFAALAAVQLMLRFNRRRPLLIAVPATVFAVLALMLAVPGTSLVQDQITTIADVFSLDTNGLRGRYSGHGGLTANLRFIADSPFSPVGAGYSADLMYGDSGLIEFMLRGSVPLVLAIYSGLFLFFRRNLLSRSQGLMLFLVFFGFEIGFSNLLYFRTQFFMPFMVVYLNHLERLRPALKDGIDA